MASEFKHIRVEDVPPISPEVLQQIEQRDAKLPTVQGTIQVQGGKVVSMQVEHDAAHWRRLAQDAAHRLSIAETQNSDLRKAADEARQRFTKYKERMDHGTETINRLQVSLVSKTAECEDLRRQLLSQRELADRVHACRRALIDFCQKGPLWDLFSELVSPTVSLADETKPPAAGGEVSS